MTKDQALARRDELSAQRERVQEQRDALEVEMHRIREQEDPATLAPDGRPRPGSGVPRPMATERALAEARVDAARGRGGATDEVKRLEEQRESIAVKVDELLSQQRAIGPAKQGIDADIAQLQRDEFEAFAEHCEQFTRDAQAKLDMLRPVYEDAYEAWQQAQREWGPIAKANGLPPIDAPPIPPPHQVFNAGTRLQRMSAGSHREPRPAVAIRGSEAA